MADSNNNPEDNIELLCQRFVDWVALPNPDKMELAKQVIYQVSEYYTQTIKDVDYKVFRSEIAALRLELFLLACDEHFKNVEKSIKLCTIMRHYLEQRGRLDLWEVMGDYNFALEESKYLPIKTQKAREKNIVDFIEQRNNLIKKWHTGEIDIRCIVRVVNRMGVDTHKWDSIGTKRLAAKLAQRLEAGSHSNVPIVWYPEGQLGLASVINGTYNGGKSFIVSHAKYDEEKEALNYLIDRESEWLHSAHYRDDGSGYGLLWDWWFSKFEK